MDARTIVDFFRPYVGVKGIAAVLIGTKMLATDNDKPLTRVERQGEDLVLFESTTGPSLLVAERVIAVTWQPFVDSSGGTFL